MASGGTGKVFIVMTRQFVDSPALEGQKPLLLGLVAPSSGGKTYSALRIATGIQRVKGGEIFFVDTENGRALHYAKDFQYRHVPLVAPFGPLDYIAAIDHCVQKKASVCIVDSMTHEHTGAGGILDQSEKSLDQWCGDDEAARKRNLLRSFIKPKQERRKLIDYIVHASVDTAFIFCFRAKEGIDIKDKDKFGNPREKGYQPETTSPLQYEMAAQFLLLPGSDGVPTLESTRREEAQMIKFPIQFRDWFPAGKRVVLDESVGERFAQWAQGPSASKPVEQSQPIEGFNPDDGSLTHEANIADWALAMRECKSMADLKALQKSAGDYVVKHGLKDSPLTAKLAEARDAARARLEAPR